MSRLHAGSLAVHLQEVSVYDVLPTALKSIAAPAEAIELIESPEVSDIRTDPGLLERVLANLIDNAISHGKSGKRPQISISEHDQEVQVRIIDYGKGIEPSLVTAAFAPFTRLGDVDNDRGVGLGLALSQAWPRRSRQPNFGRDPRWRTHRNRDNSNVGLSGRSYHQCLRSCD